MSKYQLFTRKEQKICEIITSKDFPIDKFINISRMLINRVSRRSERIRLNKMVKTDFINGFKREHYFYITNFNA